MALANLALGVALGLDGLVDFGLIMNPFESPKSAPSGRKTRHQEERPDPLAIIALMIICAVIAISQLFR